MVTLNVVCLDVISRWSEFFRNCWSTRIFTVVVSDVVNLHLTKMAEENGTALPLKKYKMHYFSYPRLHISFLLPTCAE